MNNFFIKLPAKPEKATITYSSSVVLFGSCFVANIGQKLTYHKLPNYTNPFGIIFHPEAINNLIERIVLQKRFTESDLFFHNEQWHCFEVHSQFSNTQKEELLNDLNAYLNETLHKIKSASHFVMTYGTAWGYTKDNTIVANCHKVSQKEFHKKISTISEIKEVIKNTCDLLFSINPLLKIITTVSPVRHIKDGVVENNLSKAHLLSALHSICNTSEHIKYYPAYELVIDCLRDYRFYNNDLVHPNQMTIDFIWEHFVSTWLHNPETKVTLSQIDEIQRGLLHRPFNPESEAHQKFLHSLKKKKEILIKKHSFIEF